MSIRCDACNCDMVAVRGRDHWGWLQWWLHDDNKTVAAVDVLCRRCASSNRQARRVAETSLSLNDGPLEWFSGARALPRFAQLVVHYDFGRGPLLIKLASFFLAVGAMPTLDDDAIDVCSVEPIYPAKSLKRGA